MKFKSSAITLALSLALFPAPQQADPISKIELPDMGDSSGTLISPAEEKEFGEAFFRSLHSQIAINQDAEIQQYIQTIGERLVVNSDAPGNPFHFFVVMENNINAFAGPGGYIGVNSGLILITEAESELASVMAHEIAHVTQRHLYRAYEAASRLSIPTAAATLAAILLGTQSPALGQAAIIAIQAGNVQFQIDFTRENEAEADRVGMQTLAGSQFDPRSMPIFFERLQQSSRYYGQNIPEFLRTHPVTASRISDTRGRAETYPYKQYPDSLGYQLTKAKIRVLTSTDDADTLNYLQSRLNQGTTEQRAVTRYGLAMSALKSQKFNAAESIFQQLSKEYPNQPQYVTALAHTALDSKNYSIALARYKKLTEQFPNNEAIKLEYITALLKAGNAELARKNLFQLQSKTQRLPIYSQLLAQVYSDLNQPAESHRYLAEYYYATGQTKDAILQIKLAQKSKGLNFQLSSILNERLNFFINQEEEARRNQ
ncbi:MAG: M48 family metalloprotease [Methylobacter sp.]|uniref:Putative beta-barrel assembly-enhancing protease n=1 Tax=Candidatus Methylobacter titanis TaxID=3053457 RepID=A0AA43THX5_9GAMM|nr:M48 family metalloprotease [Candidatus Methylobacter titanis]MDI1293864.1 M48 family metalloprotease [Candidatus Methylobacter titanis]